MALIATRDFHRVLKKRVGEIVHSYVDDLEIKAQTLQGNMLINSTEKVCLRLVCKAIEALIKH